MVSKFVIYGNLFTAFMWSATFVLCLVGGCPPEDCVGYFAAALASYSLASIELIRSRI